MLKLYTLKIRLIDGLSFTETNLTQQTTDFTWYETI